MDLMAFGQKSSEKFGDLWWVYEDTVFHSSQFPPKLALVSMDFVVLLLSGC
jgi:hypothetical protein